MKNKKILATILVLFSFFFANSQDEDILCSSWCLKANYVMKSQFGASNCIYLIEKTPSNQIILTGWCNQLASISMSMTETYSQNGTLLESLYNSNGFVESSYKTGNETLIFHSLEDTYPNCYAYGPCTKNVEVIEGVECPLLKDLDNNGLVYALDYAHTVDQSLFVIGAKLRVGYIPVDYPSFCLQGDIQAIITCAENMPVSTDFEICTSFEEYSAGNLVPQGSPVFSLFSGSAAQNALVVNDLAATGSKSMKCGNGTSIDFNISRELTEQKVARVQWKVYLPEGKTGRIGLETNNAANYPIVMEFSNGDLTTYSFANNVYTKLAGPYYTGTGRWLTMALIFQPFENEVELWADHYLIYKLTNYMSNKVEDINFYSINTSANNEYYIDDLCYFEWSRDEPCTFEVDPVCVNEVEYSNSCIAYLSGYNGNEYYAGECGFAACTPVIQPMEGALEVPVNTNILWEQGDKVQTYLVNVYAEGQIAPLTTRIVEGNITSMSLTGLPQNKVISVELTGRNTHGSKYCGITRFKTVTGLQLPSCASITYPPDNATNIPSTVNVSWMPSATAQGYRLRAGTSPGGSDLLNNYDIGNVTNYVFTNLPSGSQICLSVIPYNAAGQNLGCTGICFRTASPSGTGDDDLKRVSVYPNPTDGDITVQNLSEGHFSLFNLMGEVVMHGPITHEKISVQHLSAGLYLLALGTNSKTNHFLITKI